MTEAEKKQKAIENGLDAVGDEKLNEVAGGSGFDRCDYGQVYESQFPERCCKNCPHFTCTKSDKNSDDKKYKMECSVHQRTEWKNVDFWDLS
ncbi:MAG TPA: hypothetical protein DEB31_01485 [Clostridiales bacterium]|nr:hypothetical protein [Clostridiales bacterium]